MLQTFVDHIKSTHLFEKKDEIVVAFSGGVDSIVLCSLLHQSGYSFRIAHCNFQLRGKESDKDEEFAATIAQLYKVQYHVKSFDTEVAAKERKVSIQMAARTLRYDWLEEVREKHKCTFVATAHHKDDEIETVLMNLVKGTGIAGLHGIAPKIGKIIRPMLFTDKNSIREFAQKHQLKYREEASNESNKYERNKIRQQVIPILQEINPSFNTSFIDNISKFKEVELLYDQGIAEAKKKLLDHKNEETFIPIRKLLKFIPVKTILYELLKEYNFNISQVEQILLSLDKESGKIFSSKTHTLIKDRRFLIISPQNAENISRTLIDAEQKGIRIKDLHLKISINDPKNFTIPKSETYCSMDNDLLKFPLTLRRWEKGDYFYPFGMKKKKKKISDFFIDQKLSIPQKNNTWILCSGKRIAWIVGLRMDERFKVSEKTKKICIFEKIEH